VKSDKVQQRRCTSRHPSHTTESSMSATTIWLTVGTVAAYYGARSALRTFHHEIQDQRKAVFALICFATILLVLLRG